MHDGVAYEVDGHVALITLDRPEARNAISRAVAQAMEAAIDRMEADPEIRVGILRANTAGQERPVFCAGADLKALGGDTPAGLSTERGGFGGLAYRHRDKPLIAAVDGLATAGGCELVLATDLIVATTRSAFGLAEVKRNLIAGAGGLYRLPRALGQAVALEAILTGEPIPAQRAYDLGMVNRLVPPGGEVAEAMRLAGAICAVGPMAVQAGRRIVLAAETETDETLRQMTAEAFAALLASDDTKEALRAFAEKRPAVWRGR